MRALAALVLFALAATVVKAECVCEVWHVDTPMVVDCDCEWYTVKPNGKLPTRPAYTLVNGALIKSKARAPVGATCDLRKPTKPSGEDLWASYDSTSLVALCSKR